MHLQCKNAKFRLFQKERKFTQKRIEYGTRRSVATGKHVDFGHLPLEWQRRPSSVRIDFWGEFRQRLFLASTHLEIDGPVPEVFDANPPPGLDHSLLAVLHR